MAKKESTGRRAMASASQLKRKFSVGREKRKVQIDPVKAPPESKYLWILDNGHGDNTPGKRSPVFPDGTQLFEYKFNREIVKRLIKLLEGANISYHNLVPELTDISLGNRVKRANELQSDKPKFYVSIHGNGFGKTFNSANGLETYHYPSSVVGRRLAGVFQEELIEETQLRDRGIKTANFYVLKYTSMPSILTENGFFTNKEECLKMLDPRFQDRIAKAHFRKRSSK